MNGLMAFQESVGKAVSERKASSKSITVSENGQSLVIRHSYFSYLVKVPHFHHLSKGEQDDVLRIYRSVNIDFFAEFFGYHYDNISQEENGYSYVVDNVRYILSLPETGAASVVMKFLLLSAVGKMKFLSKRNIDLFFVETDRVMEILDSVKVTGRKLSLEKVFALFDREFYVSIKDPLYRKNSEGLFYLRMILARWLSNKELSFREIVMMQAVFRHELPAVGKPTESGLSERELRKFLDIVALLLSYFSRSYDNSSDPVKVLFDDTLTDGLADTTLQELMAYLQFFDWVPPMLNEEKRANLCSLKKFKKEFSVDFSKFDRELYVNFFIDTVANEIFAKDGLFGIPDNVILNSANEYYFLFCLLNGDEEKFVDFMGVLENDLAFQYFDDNLRYRLLTMAKEYSEDEEFISASLLFNLYDIGSLLDA